MAHPIGYIPLLGSNPVGWAVLGTAGYLAYRAGKKSGQKSDQQVERENLADRTIKGAMKTAYKTKKKVDTSLTKTREKYSGMWQEARNELEGEA
ncbi:MAG: hypothetical protein CSA34_01715 [Desulfobulbus propionicus]|nr:MAG: hypothetical protein CSA34_01715 [Desulfobulbus propionicus]